MAYNTNASIDAYYEGQKAPVNAQMENTTASYEAAIKRLEESKAQADADAYRSYVRQQKEMPALMRSNGNHGGMVDSAVASLFNKYNQGRANRSAQLQGDAADQTLQYNNDMNSLRAKLTAYEQEANADKAELAYKQAKGSGSGKGATEEEEAGNGATDTGVMGNGYNRSLPKNILGGPLADFDYMSGSKRLGNKKV